MSYNKNINTLRRYIRDIKKISEHNYHEIRKDIKNELKEIPKNGSKMLYLKCIRDGLKYEIKQTTRRQTTSDWPTATPVTSKKSQSDSAIAHQKKITSTETKKRKRTVPVQKSALHHIIQKYVPDPIIVISDSDSNSSMECTKSGRESCSKVMHLDDTAQRQKRTKGKYRKCQSCTSL
ncbi:hypothetical protein PPYR_04810 [Photinus pyralis]|uniref:Uncharacterized protein n=1 Tax=Photinus pyralis TaxID=7054 RepID=A0A1Y1JX08_PHOPY|nr:hypothetical protein PPYR_04810 [Photinus pyralis]